MDDILKPLSKELIQQSIGYEPTEEELADYHKVVNKYNTTITNLYNKYITSPYKGESAAGMAWAIANSKTEILSVGAEPELEEDRELLYASIAAAVNDAVAKSLEALTDYKIKYSEMIQNLSKDFYDIFSLNVDYVDPKLLN